MSVQGTRTAGAATQSTQQESRELAQSAKESASQVAQTVKDEASTVASEIKSQTQTLAGEAKNQVRSRAEAQKSAAAGALRTTGDELHSLVNEREHSRLTTELTRRAAEQAHTVADYLDNKGAAEILDDVRDFARRRPGVFLLAAGFAGVVVGRLVRGTMAASGSPSPKYAAAGSSSRYTPPYPETTYPETAAPQPAVLPPGTQTTSVGSVPVTTREDLP